MNSRCERGRERGVPAGSRQCCAARPPRAQTAPACRGGRTRGTRPRRGCAACSRAARCAAAPCGCPAAQTASSASSGSSLPASRSAARAPAARGAAGCAAEGPRAASFARTARLPPTAPPLPPRARRRPCSRGPPAGPARAHLPVAILDPLSTSETATCALLPTKQNGLHSAALQRTLRPLGSRKEAQARSCSGPASAGESRMLRRCRGPRSWRTGYILVANDLLAWRSSRTTTSQGIARISSMSCTTQNGLTFLRAAPYARVAPQHDSRAYNSRNFRVQAIGTVGGRTMHDAALRSASGGGGAPGACSPC